MGRRSTGARIYHDAYIVPTALQLMAICPDIGFKTGIAIDALGEVKINGVLTESSGAFKIDHPVDASNKYLRYQLTAVGGPAPDLHVKTKLANGSFTIAGAKAGQEVCWQITGTRKDAWANANRAQVEPAKPKSERGTYLFPQGFGKPEEKRLGYRDPAARPAR